MLPLTVSVVWPTELAERVATSGAGPSGAARSSASRWICMVCFSGELRCTEIVQGSSYDSRVGEPSASLNRQKEYHHAPCRYTSKPVSRRRLSLRHHPAGGHLSSHVGRGDSRTGQRHSSAVDCNSTRL